MQLLIADEQRRDGHQAVDVGEIPSRPRQRPADASQSNNGTAVEGGQENDRLSRSRLVGDDA